MCSVHYITVLYCTLYSLVKSRSDSHGQCTWKVVFNVRLRLYQSQTVGHMPYETVPSCQDTMPRACFQPDSHRDGLGLRQHAALQCCKKTIPSFRAPRWQRYAGVPYTAIPSWIVVVVYSTEQRAPPLLPAPAATTISTQLGGSQVQLTGSALVTW